MSIKFKEDLVTLNSETWVFEEEMRVLHMTHCLDVLNICAILHENSFMHEKIIAQT